MAKSSGSQGEILAGHGPEGVSGGNSVGRTGPGTLVPTAFANE
jgi:hypothetical protein